MDKDILRIVIIIIGVLVITGMVVWNYLKNRKNRRNISFYDDGEPLGKIDESLVIETKDDDFDIIPLGGVNDHDEADELIQETKYPSNEMETEFQPELKHHAAEPEQEPELEIPNIIQFSIVAVGEQGFSSEQLFQAFAKVGLKYGSNQVYERLDEYDQVDFAVASMVEPGVFPAQDVESFTCPGIVFFFQPKLVNDALVVFDDLVETIHIVSAELGGIEWDQDRQPLTANTEQIIRSLLVQENLKL